MEVRDVRNTPFFSALSETERELVLRHMQPERRSSGQVLFSRGEDSKAFYLIESGWVWLVAEGGMAIASMGAGSLVGEADLLFERPHSLGATLASDADLWALNRDDLTRLIHDNPQIGVKLSLVFGECLPLIDPYLVEQRLRPLPFLCGLAEPSLKSIARRLVPVVKKGGEPIVERGQPAQALFIVESGHVHLQGADEEQGHLEMGPGTTFGEMAVLAGKPHTHSARAAGDLVLWALPADQFEPLTADHPEVRAALARTLREPLAAHDGVQAAKRLSGMPLFAALPEEALRAVAGRMVLRHVPAGDWVFSEGTPGDGLYVIDSGRVEIVSRARPTPVSLGPDRFFGESALLTDRPRPTAARAAAHTNLWFLHRSDFEELANRYPSISLALSRLLSERLAEVDQRSPESSLGNVKLLAGLSPSQLEEVGRRLTPVHFAQGDTILREGGPAGELFIVESGQVEVTQGRGREAVVLYRLEAGDSFGEAAMLTGSPQSATVTALSEVQLWSLMQADLDYLVATYPSVAIGLSRLLSERLRQTEQRARQLPAVGTAAPARYPQRAVAPSAGAARTVEVRRVRRRPRQGLSANLRARYEDAVTWFGALDRGYRIRLLLIALLVAWLLGIAAPAILISTLAADHVTDLTGAIAFVQREPVPIAALPSAGEDPAALAAPPAGEVEAEALSLDAAIPESAEMPAAAARSVGVELAAAEPAVEAKPPEPTSTATPVPPTATPWIIVVTNTPAPPTDTPVPTETPIPPTATPTSAPVKVAAKPPAPKPTATPAVKPQPPRDLDPRLPALNVSVVEPAGLAPGQSYWRLVSARWQGPDESGNDHTIYIEVLDENGARIVGQPVEVRWGCDMLAVYVEDKPPPTFGANFPMYGLLGSYSVSVPGLPSDTIVGLGMGTPDSPAFKIHTNFLLIFRRTQY